MISEADEIIKEAARRGLVFQRLIQSLDKKWRAEFSRGHRLYRGTGDTMLEAVRNAAGSTENPDAAREVVLCL